MFMFKRQNKTARKSSASHQSDSEPRPATVSTPIGDFVCYPELTPFTEYYLFRPNHQQILLQAVKKAQAGEPVDWQRICCYGRLMLAADKSGFKAQLLLDQDMVQETRSRRWSKARAIFSPGFRGGQKAARCMCAGRQTSECTVLPSRGRL